MAIRVGRGSVRTLQTPGNQGMARRVDQRINGLADAQAAKHATALAVDGVLAFIWNRGKGSIPCTCQGFKSFSGAKDYDGAFNESGDTANVQVDENGNVQRSISSSGHGDGYRYVGGSLNEDNLEDYLSQKSSIGESIKEKIEQPSKHVEDFRSSGDFLSSSDVLDALASDGSATTNDEDGDPLNTPLGGNLLGNPNALMTPTMVQCPICYGAGYIDSWQFYNGQRILLDFSDQFDIEVGDIEFSSDNQPVSAQIQEGSYVQWESVGLPQTWRHLLRLFVFNRGQLIDPSKYKLSYYHVSAPNTKIPLDFSALSALKGSATLRTSNKLTFMLEPIDGKTLEFTHVELLFSLGEVVKIQVPDVEVPRADEFADWNLNAGFEFPANVTLKESSYFTDGKYKRVWKIESINRRLTAGGKSTGYSVNARALHSFERLYVGMGVLGDPIDPFALDVDESVDDEL